MGFTSENNPNKKKQETTTDTVVMEPPAKNISDPLLTNYYFELIKTYERYKPERVVLTGPTTEHNSGRDKDNIYPPKWILPNKGIAYCDTTKAQRAWRFISSENSIWIDEQRLIEDPKEEGYILSSEENQLEFIWGKCMVRGIEKSKFDALCVQDMFEGKKVKLRQIPPVYRLLDPVVELKTTMDLLDEAYQAEKAAREASTEDMMAFASVLGIGTDQDVTTIRKDFIIKAKTSPKFFLNHFSDQRNKIYFVFKEALKKNIINADNLNRLVWGENNDLIFVMHPDKEDINEHLTSLVLGGDEKAARLYNRLKNM